MTTIETRQLTTLRDELELMTIDGITYCVNNANSTSYAIRDGRCSCPDYVYRRHAKGERCKHLQALDQALEQRYEVVGDGRTPSTQIEPEPEWIIDDCPECGGPVVVNTYYVGGRGYIVREECWGSLGSHREATCNYRRVR